MFQQSSTDRRRIAVLVVIAAVLAVTVGSGPVAAHNPACHQVAGPDGPHYDDDDRTGSDTAYDRNKNLGGDDFGGPDQAADECSAGDSQASHSDD